MANPTMTLIASVTVGSGGAATIDFSSIPSTYTDLCVKLSARSTSSTTTVYSYLILNNNTSNSYAYRRIDGNGSGVVSSSGTSSVGAYTTVTDNATSTSNTFSNSELYFPNYAGTTNKSISVDSVTENNGSVANATMWAASAAITTAINEITLVCADGNYTQYSTAYLYGINNS